jgi:hypothetical protein
MQHPTLYTYWGEGYDYSIVTKQDHNKQRIVVCTVQKCDTMQHPSLYTYWGEGYDYRISDLIEEPSPKNTAVYCLKSQQILRITS